MISANFPALLQSFFTDRLLRQRQASAHTIAGYRDCFRLLLQFAKKQLGKMPSQIQIEDLDAPFIGLFLDHLESTRKNSARTRNARLGAIHSFFRYVALEEPVHALHCQRILAVPNKRHVRRPIEFLNREEIDALLGSESFHLDRTSRSNSPPARTPDRPTSFRADWTELPRCRVGDRSPRALPREGQKTALHAPPTGYGKDDGRVATGTPRARRRSGLSQYPGWPTQP